MGDDDALFGAVPSEGGPLVFVDDVMAPVLNDHDHHHLARVRRTRDGDAVVISDGAGNWCHAVMAGHNPEVVGAPVAQPRLSPDIAVGFGLSKANKPELCVQKLTELGVDHIHPFTAARSVVRWDADKIHTAHRRFVKVAREAAMQCRTAWLPVVEPVVSLGDLASDPRACRADRHGDPPSLERPLILVGPEGGWDHQERALDLPAVALGTQVMRAETAVIVAGAILAGLRSGLLA